MIRKLIHRLIVFYLNKYCDGTFHTFQYGNDGRYVTLMTDNQYNKWLSIK